MQDKKTVSSLYDRIPELISFLRKTVSFNGKMECFFKQKLSSCVSGKYTLLLNSKGVLNFEAKR